ncbi:MAG: hypothetical protein E6R03_16400 [Hyphomicrobiaceae bacterium]|nr:MAG: hypothetical protein E6R03_16400 [Hyphomicrobiaceae bacterium]
MDGETQDRFERIENAVRETTAQVMALVRTIRDVFDFDADTYDRNLQFARHYLDQAEASLQFPPMEDMLETPPSDAPTRVHWEKDFKETPAAPEQKPPVRESVFDCASVTTHKERPAWTNRALLRRIYEGRDWVAGWTVLGWNPQEPMREFWQQGEVSWSLYRSPEWGVRVVEVDPEIHRIYRYVSGVEETR